MGGKALIAGVGMVPFTKPGAGDPYDVMGEAAGRMALEDAGLTYDDVEQAYAGYVFGDSTSGQKVLYRLGMTEIPAFNVNNNCSTGSSALFLARQAIESGAAECALAIGFEQMQPGALGRVFTDKPDPFERFNQEAQDLLGEVALPHAIRMFGGAGLEHMRRYGTSLQTFAEVRAKASRHAAHNPLAIFRKEMSAEEVLAAPAIWPGVMTRLMACPPTCGAAAAVVVSDRFAARRGLSADVAIRAQAMTTDGFSTFAAHDMRCVVGYDMTRAAARKVYEAACVGPGDVDVVELHDCFAHNEVITYEALGLCPEGEAAKFVADGDNTYGGRIVTNPSGGLLSKGHPLGATGLAQCFELVQQMRGQAGPRQVDGVRLALQHNLGLGGACVVTLYERA